MIRYFANCRACAIRHILPLLLSLALLLAAAPCTYAEVRDVDTAAQRSLSALEDALREENENVWVYRDFGDTENHFTQKALMAGIDKSLVHDMDENWTDHPHTGRSCIRCEQILRSGSLTAHPGSTTATRTSRRRPGLFWLRTVLTRILLKTGKGY